MPSRDLGRRLEGLSLPPVSVLTTLSVPHARATWARYREAAGFKLAPTPLLTAPDGNVKLAKSTGDGLASYGLSLAPASLSEDWNVCRWSTPVCRATCVAFAGKGELPDVIRARVAKTRFLAEEPVAFLTLLVSEIETARRKHGPALRVRLNTFADLRWEVILPSLFAWFADVSFYDYTKCPDREPPANYRLTFSASERTTAREISRRTGRGERVAVVFSPSAARPLPTMWDGVPVVDGDLTDDRSADPPGVIVGLRAKGRMRKNGGAFVRQVPVSISHVA